MPDYKTMYFKLAAKMADAIESLDKVSRDLKIAQIETEEMYISSEDEKGEDMTNNTLTESTET